MRLLRADLHTLTGAYALDAVEGPERDKFELHLRRCRPCDDEVRGLAETATSLGMAAAAPPPAAMRSRVLAATLVTRQLPPAPAPAAERPRRPRIVMPWTGWLVTGMAVACLAIAVAFTVVGVSAQRQLTELQARNRAIAAVLAAPDARIASERTTRGGSATVLVSHAEGRLVVTTSGLPKLPSSEVYQLWLIGPPRIRSAGLVPAASAGRTAPVLASGLRAGDQVGMTVEPAGGTSRPTTKPILLMTLPG